MEKTTQTLTHHQDQNEGRSLRRIKSSENEGAREKEPGSICSAVGNKKKKKERGKKGGDDDMGAEKNTAGNHPQKKLIGGERKAAGDKNLEGVKGREKL